MSSFASDATLVDGRFTPYLQNNDLPSPSILEDVNEAKNQPLSELETIERDVRTLDIVQSVLRKRRNALKASLTAYDSILGPIRRLSDDVLEEIFCHCIPTTRYARPFVSESPLLLTLVCKKWRTIALSSPRLWTTLHIPVAFSYNPIFTSLSSSSSFQFTSSTPAPISQLRLSELQTARQVGLDQWLRRSGTLPLAVSLHSHASFRSSNVHAQASAEEQTLDLVARYADRLSTIEAVVPQTTAEELAKAIKRYFGFTHLPRLRCLRVSYDMRSYPIVGQPLSQVPMLFSSESLRELVLKVPPDDVRQAMALCSNTITALSVHTPIDISLAHHILSRLHRLERCHFTIFNPHVITPGQTGSTSTAPPPAEICLPALTTLSVAGTLSEIQSLCEPLKATSLSNLQLHVAPQHMVFQLDVHVLATEAPSPDRDLAYPPASTERLSAFLAQSTALRTLVIAPSGVEPAELQSIFTNLPQIRSLVLNNSTEARTGFSIYHRDTLSLLTQASTSMKYALHPLLSQERVSTHDGESIHIEEMLLPELTALTWNQFSSQIPNELLVAFIKNRLHRPMHPESPGVSQQKRPTVPLRDIKIQLFRQSEADDIEAEINRHAELVGLKRGVDFNLDISVYPSSSTEIGTAPVPRYCIPKGYAHAHPVVVTEDNVSIEHDATWPFIDV